MKSELGDRLGVIYVKLLQVTDLAAGVIAILDDDIRRRVLGVRWSFTPLRWLPFRCGGSLLHFDFKLPGGELAQRGVHAGDAELLVADLNLPCSIQRTGRFVASLICWPEFEFQFGEFDFLPGCQIYCLRHDPAVHSGKRTEADLFAIAIRQGWEDIDEVLTVVLEFNCFLPDVAYPDDQGDRVAVTVGQLLDGLVPQTRLHSTDFFAPFGERLRVFCFGSTCFLSS